VGEGKFSGIGLVRLWTWGGEKREREINQGANKRVKRGGMKVMRVTQGRRKLTVGELWASVWLRGAELLFGIHGLWYSLVAPLAFHLRLLALPSGTPEPNESTFELTVVRPSNAGPVVVISRSS
jgi:hypothetical protein